MLSRNNTPSPLRIGGLKQIPSLTCYLLSESDGVISWFVMTFHDMSWWSIWFREVIPTIGRAPPLRIPKYVTALIYSIWGINRATQNLTNPPDGAAHQTNWPSGGPDYPHKIMKFYQGQIFAIFLRQFWPFGGQLVWWARSSEVKIKFWVTLGINFMYFPI